MKFQSITSMPLNSTNTAVNAQLKKIADGKNIGNILLFGEIGSGKTEIAKSIPLWFSTAKGHPNTHQTFIDCTHGLPTSQVVNFAETVCTTPSGIDFMVLDEIDKLPSPKQIYTLLTPLTCNPNEKMFILIANDISKIPDSVVSRCNSLHIKTPTPYDVLEYYMDQIASKGGNANEQQVLESLIKISTIGANCRDYERVIDSYKPK